VNTTSAAINCSPLAMYSRARLSTLFNSVIAAADSRSACRAATLAADIRSVSTAAAVCSMSAATLGIQNVTVWPAAT
jgi:hypothetical protein